MGKSQIKSCTQSQIFTPKKLNQLAKS